MEFVRTVLLIVALVLGWGAVRADPAMVFGLLGCVMPALGRWGVRRSAFARVGGLALR